MTKKNPLPSLCSLPLVDALQALKKRKLILQKAGSCAASQKLANICTKLDDLEAGDIFIAYKGVQFDGHKQIPEARKAGAGLIIFEDDNFSPAAQENIIFIKVKQSRLAWSILCAEACGNPQTKMEFVGVTGTNGKSSTVWFLRNLAKQLNKQSISIGTLGLWVGEDFYPTSHTTPDPPQFFSVLKLAFDAGIKLCFMEVSSHALSQFKVDVVPFGACAFTSFSRDHLDLHGTLEEYFSAKLRLFLELATPSSRAVIFEDVINSFGKDEKKAAFLKQHKDLWIYGHAPKRHASLFPKANFLTIKVEKKTTQQTSISLFKNDQLLSKGDLPFISDFSVENFCAALLCLEKLVGDLPSSDQWSKLPQVPGRLEAVTRKTQTDKGPFVYVDYAHTPDALERVLQAGRRILQGGHLWVVFGCGGERDKGKRPQMAKIAATLADQIVVTSDNPRSENPTQIIEDICAGFVTAKKSIKIESDRKKAIGYAIANANAQDVVIIAGKGHEDYMLIGKDKLHFDDRLVAHDFLAQLKD